MRTLELSSSSLCVFFFLAITPRHYLIYVRIKYGGGGGETSNTLMHVKTVINLIKMYTEIIKLIKLNQLQYLKYFQVQLGLAFKYIFNYEINKQI